SYLADPLRNLTVLHLPVIVTIFSLHPRPLCCFKTLHK
ncbi:hypothetical protein N312_08835, partial [Balearica regulorum gibbericeps]